ncbi:MAG: hypothetical protein R3350_04695 [Saprospiraceae bacterium]|nr:hypothetical protein [Saprospiraceae bacterium]
MFSWDWSLLAIVFILSCTQIAAQKLTGIGTRWDNSFREWIIYADDETEGTLQLRFNSISGDWIQWEYRLGEVTGRIRQKWPNDPNVWEIRGDNQIFTARTIWRGDVRQWRITNNDYQLALKTRYGNSAEEWEIRHNELGYFGIYTAWEGDPRDWEIIDELRAEVSLHAKIAAVFIALFHSTPKR